MFVKEECYLIECGYRQNTFFKRGIYIPYNYIYNFVTQHHYYSVFRSAYCYNNANINNAKLYGDFYLDLDDTDDFERVRVDALTALSYLKICYHITNVRVFFSGNKGVHLIIPAPILGVEPRQHLNVIYKQLATAINNYTTNKTVDLKVYDRRRLFRIVNTIHEKSHLFKIPLSKDELQYLSLDKIKLLAKSKRNITITNNNLDNPFARLQFDKFSEQCNNINNSFNYNNHYAQSINFIPPCIKLILDNGAKQGERNISIACLTSFLKAYGKSLNETIEIINNWNSNNVVPSPSYELHRTIKSIYTSNSHYGCSTLKQLIDCSYQCNNCRFNKDISKKER